jgi:hypothetical protein
MHLQPTDVIGRSPLDHFSWIRSYSAQAPLERKTLIFENINTVNLTTAKKSHQKEA